MNPSELPDRRPEPNTARSQFTLRGLLLTVLFYGALFGATTALGMSLLQVCLIAATLTFFIACDALLLRNAGQPASVKETVALYISYYATALAVADLACYAAHVFTERVQTLTHGALFAYVAIFVVLSTIGFVGSVCASRESRLAPWLMLVDIPGTGMFIGILVVFFADADWL